MDNQFPNFLDDKPEKDYFIHSKEQYTTFEINKEILKETILTPKDYSKKIIALCGKWGSGKSTIIEMLKNDCEEIKVVEFDVWTDGEEQVKRSFLINLYKQLEITGDDYNPNNKSELEKYITGNVKTIDIENKPKWEKSTKILAVIVLLYFLFSTTFKIVSFIGDIIYSINTFNYSKNEDLCNSFWTLGLCSIFIIIFLCFIEAKKEVKYKVLKKIKEFWNNMPQYIFPFINNSSDNTITNSTETQSFDITGYEFREYYNNILDRAKEIRIKNLLIVIDNLDRLEADKIKNVIDDIQLFVRVKHSLNVWFVVLIDKSKFFYNQDKQKKDNEKHIHNAEFFEKIFPIRLEITDINNLDWRGFFDKQLGEAFGNIKIDNDIKTKTKWIFEDFSETHTPRDIIYFINKIAYNYRVNILAKIENGDINKNFQASVLNAIYSIFIAEREYKRGVVKYIEHLNNSHSNGDEENNKKWQSSHRFSNIWYTLLLKSYYQTDKPYDVLFKKDLKNSIEKCDKAKIEEIKNGMPSDSIFIDLIMQEFMGESYINDKERIYNIIDSFRYISKELKVSINEPIENFIKENNVSDFISTTFTNSNNSNNQIKNIMFNALISHSDINDCINIIIKENGNLYAKISNNIDIFNEKKRAINIDIISKYNIEIIKSIELFLYCYINFENFEKNEIIKNINDFIKSLNEIYILQNANHYDEIDKKINDFLNKPKYKKEYLFLKTVSYLELDKYDLYFDSSTYINNLISQFDMLFDTLLKLLNFLLDDKTIIINNNMDKGAIEKLKNTIEILKSSNNDIK